MINNKNLLMLTFSVLVFFAPIQVKSLAQTASNPVLIVPDKETYGDFLISPWKEGAPVLVAFKDPLCGYCIKALKQRARLQNYNVFLFWSPILSERSKIKVNGFFSCKNPVTDEILNAVMDRKTVNCNGPENIKLRQLNDDMMARYQPNFVPQYWFSGQRQSYAQLKLSESSIDIIKQIESLSHIKIPWQRYSELAVNEKQLQGIPNIALVLPTNIHLSDNELSALKSDQTLNWFLLSDSTSSNKRDIEFRMLNNIQSSSQALYILEGKLLSPEEQKRVVADKLVIHSS
jgi:hypothetical protein